MKQRRQNAFVSKYRVSSYFPHYILKLNAETGQTIDKHNTPHTALTYTQRERGEKRQNYCNIALCAYYIIQETI